jgi:hypothetical protein
LRRLSSVSITFFRSAASLAGTRRKKVMAAAAVRPSSAVERITQRVPGEKT